MKKPITIKIDGEDLVEWSRVVRLIFEQFRISDELRKSIWRYYPREKGNPTQWMKNPISSHLFVGPEYDPSKDKKVSPTDNAYPELCRIETLLRKIIQLPFWIEYYNMTPMQTAKRLDEMYSFASVWECFRKQMCYLKEEAEGWDNKHPFFVYLCQKGLQGVEGWPVPNGHHVGKPKRPLKLENGVIIFDDMECTIYIPWQELEPILADLTVEGELEPVRPGRNEVAWKQDAVKLFLKYCQKEGIRSFKKLTEQKKIRAAARYVAEALRMGQLYPNDFEPTDELPSADRKESENQQADKVRRWLTRDSNHKAILASWDETRDETLPDSSHPQMDIRETTAR